MPSALPACDVLLVDDDRDIRETIAQILTDEGYRIATAIHGADALAVLRATAPPRLILLDLMMPVMDGRRFLARLAQEPAFAAVPVVVISGSGNLAHTVTSLAVAGALAKPIELDLLLHTVKRHASP